jgi:alkylation response protein AidB-like acyl-CoA dehydrogenase
VEFEITPERAELRAAMRKCVQTQATEARIREVMDGPTGFDASLWATLAKELQVVGLRIPKAQGGSDAAFADIGVVLQELGRGPVCSPYLGTSVLAPEVLRSCDTPAALETLAAISRGDQLATVSLESDPDNLAAIGVRASQNAGTFTLSGEDPFVIEGVQAHSVVVPALIDAEVGLFLIDAGADAEGLTHTALTVMDQTRQVARLQFADCPAHLLARGDRATDILRRARYIAQVALACEQVGGAQQCVEDSAEYAKQRRQFGAVIGSFQAVKHRCADMLVAVELARSAAEYAAWCVDERPEDLAVAALVAGSLCSETYLEVAASNIQIHGGIGFTWDNPAHLYFKRAKASALMFGQPVRQRARLGTLIGL